MQRSDGAPVSVLTASPSASAITSELPTGTDVGDDTNLLTISLFAVWPHLRIPTQAATHLSVAGTDIAA